MKINDKEFKVNNKDKIFYPKAGYTKKDIMNYYEKISPYMLLFLKDRPVSMLRFPDGINGKRFYQKDAPDYFPEWITTQKIKKKKGGTTNYVICNNKAVLVYLASQACLTPHIWLSKIGEVKKPDKLIFDLDPSDEDFKKVKFAAQIIKDFFETNFSTKTYVMTTGSTGLHIFIPLKPVQKFEEVLKFAQDAALFLAQKHPKKLTTETLKKNRGNRIYLDVLRNAYGQTSVCPYSLRAIENAPIATPLDWKELKNIKSSQQYTLSTIFKRLGKKENPWNDIKENEVSLTSLKSEFAILKK